MYYIQYLTSLCRRRQWPDPLYETYGSSRGFSCIVRVNNREYQTDTVYAKEMLARENAAMRAYLICRNFSVNDGMYPSGHTKGGIMQGLPVAIGTERRTIYTEDLEFSSSQYGSSGSRSGGSSPGSYESERIEGESRRSCATSRLGAWNQRKPEVEVTPRYQDRVSARRHRNSYY